MPLIYQKALQFANTHTSRLRRRLRGYAVSDFQPYITHAFRYRENRQTYDEAHALYTFWCDLCKRNPGMWSATTGRQFVGNDRERKIKYTPNADHSIPPTYVIDDGAALAQGEYRTELRGVGQCNYFADLAFADLTSVRLPNRTPEIKKISTPGHNWVVVNSNAGRTRDMVGVDMWMYAYGASQADSIGVFSNAAYYSANFRTVSTSNEY